MIGIHYTRRVKPSLHCRGKFVSNASDFGGLPFLLAKICKMNFGLKLM